MQQEETAYYKDPPRMILDLMKDTFGNSITTYYLGSSSIVPPEAAYPCCIVQSVQGSNTIKGAPSSTDTVSELIKVIFLENSKDTANQALDTDNSLRKLYNKIQGRDPANGFYLPGTAMYTLRSNLTLNSLSTGFQTTIDHDIQTDYDIIPRGERPAIIEAVITVVTRERVIVPLRQ